MKHDRLISDIDYLSYSMKIDFVLESLANNNNIIIIIKIVITHCLFFENKFLLP